MALIGNHEEMVIDGRWPICGVDNGEIYDDLEAEEDEYIGWMKSLPRYYATECQIFCHAGIDEGIENEDIWECLRKTDLVQIRSEISGMEM